MIAELLATRFSVRQYQEKPIPSQIVDSILEAGRLSPSGGNQQPWIFGVIVEKSLIAQIAEIACQQKWMAQAPLLVVLCTIVDDSPGGRQIQLDRFPEYFDAISKMDRNLYWALNQEEHQTKIAGSHIALAALEYGIGSCWVSRFEVHRLAQLLDLPDRYIPSEILTLGYPAQNKKPTPKKNINDVVFYNNFRSGEPA